MLHGVWLLHSGAFGDYVESARQKSQELYPWQLMPVIRFALEYGLPAKETPLYQCRTCFVRLSDRYQIGATTRAKSQYYCASSRARKSSSKHEEAIICEDRPVNEKSTTVSHQKKHMSDVAPTDSRDDKRYGVPSDRKSAVCRTIVKKNLKSEDSSYRGYNLLKLLLLPINAELLSARPAICQILPRNVKNRNFFEVVSMSDYRRVSVEHAGKTPHKLNYDEQPNPTPNLDRPVRKVILCLSVETVTTKLILEMVPTAHCENEPVDNQNLRDGIPTSTASYLSIGTIRIPFVTVDAVLFGREKRQEL
ncbi:hypothetical protein Y032_0242g3451 [Ancylostoma ceylanicum]|uniref:Uncharacterized protein n=1 Tax=Ancylostoma ceylanicum TaxID=53326 RepID=A0A016SDL0_9BILA|nr:hypothetical protein Y032_0242g3451 [Ancylostoma ceylanicum]